VLSSYVINAKKIILILIRINYYNIIIFFFLKLHNINLNIIKNLFFGGLGIGDWGLGIGDWGLGPIPNPQSPIPNPQSPFIVYNKLKKLITKFENKIKNKILNLNN